MKIIQTRLWKIFLFSIMISCLQPAAALAAGGLIYFSDPQAVTGEEVEVSMTVQADGTSIGDVTVMLKYASENLEFLEGTKSSGGAGMIRVNGKGNVLDNGRLGYVLKFKPLTPGEFTVNIESCEVYDTAGQKIEMTHLGSSKITVTGESTGTVDTSLASLEVSPGKLIPDFTPEVTDYAVTVGLSVEKLTISAIPSDTANTVEWAGNDSLKEGENQISIFVKGKDGQSQSEYHINVLKTEGGEENVEASMTEETMTEAVSGVQLSCKGKTITIMDPEENLQIPDGFRESTIKIDGQPVQGWITGESSNPEYFLVYGMNDAGELNFYRYDRTEKTIQRYFEEKENDTLFTQEEFDALQTQLDAAQEDLSERRLILIILTIILFLSICLIIYLIVRLNSIGKELDEISSRKSHNEQRSLDPKKSRRSGAYRRSAALKNLQDSADEEEDDDDDGDDEDNEDDDDEPVSTKASLEQAAAASANDSTKILKPAGRRRVSRSARVSDVENASDATTVIRRENRKERNRINGFEDF